MTQRRVIQLAAFGAAVALGIGATAGCSSEVVSEGKPFYEVENRLTIVTPVSAGGGLDLNTRLMADYLERALEGNPVIQVENLPGGGTVLGTNQYANQYDHDGTSLIMLGPSTIVSWLLGAEGVEYDLTEFTPVWSVPGPALSYFNADLDLESANDMIERADELYFGIQSPTGSDMPAILALEVLGILDDVTIISGYGGGAEVAQAFDAGEINMKRDASGTFMRLRGEELENGEVTVLYSHGIADGNGGLARDPLWPDIPHFGEVYTEVTGKELSGDAWEAAVMLAEVVSQGTYSLWIHKDAPSEAISSLNDALANIADDAEYQEARVNLQGDYDELVGDEVAAYATYLEKVTPESTAWLRAFLSERFDLDL